MLAASNRELPERATAYIGTLPDQDGARCRYRSGTARSSNSNHVVLRCVYSCNA